MNLASKIFSNTLYQIVGKIITSGLGVIITIFLTRYFGPEGFGKYTFVIVVVSMFGAIADWGMSLIGVREASREESKADEIIGNILVWRLVFAFIATFSVNLFVYILPYSVEIRQLVAIASISLLAISLKSSCQIMFNSRLRMEYSALSDMAANFLVIGITIYLVSIKAGIFAFIVSFLSGHLVAALVAVLLTTRLGKLKLSLFRKDTKYLIIESLPMGAILVLFTIYNRIDTVILAYFKGDVAVGYYGAAYRIFEVVILVSAYFANSILPLISKLAKEDLVKLRKVYERSMMLLLIVGICAAVTTYVLAPLGIRIIAGESFNTSIVLLQILSISLVVSYLNHLNGYTLIALGKQWYSFFIALVALAVNLILNITLIPHHSYYAAAFVTFITEALIAIMSVFVIRRFVGIKFSLEIIVDFYREVFIHIRKIVKR